LKLKSSQAIVLSAEPFNEIDLKVEFLAPSGKVIAVAKGGRKSKRRFLNLFSELNILRVNLRKSIKTIFPIIDSADLLYQVVSPWFDRQKFEFFSQLAELLSYLGRGVPEDRVFSFWVSFIKMADTNPISEEITFLLELKILKHLGYPPKIDECVSCGRKPNRVFYFSVDRGGIVCYSCRDDNAVPLLLDEVEGLRSYLVLSDPRDVFSLPPPSSKLSNLVRQFLGYYLGYACNKISLYEEKHIIY